MNNATKVIHFLETLEIPEGRNAGKPIKLAPFQKKFIRGTLKKNTAVSVLSVARGNGKSALTAGLALAELIGVTDDQPRREVICSANTLQQAQIIWQFIQGLSASLPEDVQDDLSFRRAPYAEIAYQDHICKCIAATPRNALGSAPTLAILDERGSWDAKGDELENALLSGCGKRGGRAVIISTSARDDAHSLSKWLDEPPPGTYVQEHRPVANLPADDLKSILEANPGAKHGIGSSPKWLQAEAKRAISRGGSALAGFRLYNRNERISDDSRDVLLTTDEWLAVETDTLPPRAGSVVVGVDIGGSTSMSAAALFWPDTGRLEAVAAFPSHPSLLDRGQKDGVKDRYVEMQQRGELITLGENVVPAGLFLKAVIDRLDGNPIACIVGDRYRQSEFEEALRAAGLRVPMLYRGQGFKDSNEDCERFRSAVFDKQIAVKPSRLLRSAFADAVTLKDPANNIKLAKGRSMGRIDAASATVLAVAEGQRRAARPKSAGRAVWA